MQPVKHLVNPCTNPPASQSVSRLFFLILLRPRATHPTHTPHPATPPPTAEVGDLDKVKRVVKLLGFVNCVDGFAQQPQVVNGASDFFVQARFRWRLSFVFRVALVDREQIIPHTAPLRTTQTQP